MLPSIAPQKHSQTSCLSLSTASACSVSTWLGSPVLRSISWVLHWDVGQEGQGEEKKLA